MLVLLAALFGTAHAGFFVDHDGSIALSADETAKPALYVDEWGRIYDIELDAGRLVVGELAWDGQVVGFASPEGPYKVSHDPDIYINLYDDGGACLTAIDGVITELSAKTHCPGGAADLDGALLIADEPTIDPLLYAKDATIALANGEWLVGLQDHGFDPKLGTWMADAEGSVFIVAENDRIVVDDDFLFIVGEDGMVVDGILHIVWHNEEYEVAVKAIVGEDGFVVPVDAMLIIGENEW